MKIWERHWYLNISLSIIRMTAIQYMDNCSFVLYIVHVSNVWVHYAKWIILLGCWYDFLMRIFYILQNVQNFQGQWLNIEKFKKDHHLRDTVNFLPHIVKNAKSRSTNKKYDSYFSKFRDWCLKHSFVHLPASVSTVALFLGGLVQQRVSTSVLEAYFYSINWTH